MDVWLFEYNGTSFDGIQSLKNATTAEVETCHFTSKEESQAVLLARWCRVKLTGPFFQALRNIKI